MTTKAIPWPGDIRASHERLAGLEEGLHGLAGAHRQAAAWLTLADGDLRQLEEAAERGDLEAVKRQARRARQHVARSRTAYEQGSMLAGSLAGMLKHFRRVLKAVGL